ncbi:MAG TPA: DEAD/DEAH box helicase [Polyangiaceae bacterium]|jgi:DEAD/DEAH box helicase domain-containing protein
MPVPPWQQEQGVTAVLARWLASSWVKPCFSADATLDGASGQYSPLPAYLAPGLAAAMRDRGIDRLYAHQARALDATRAGKHLVVATPTASGKSLCFHLPVLQAAIDDPDARSLYLYPTKALSRDQEFGLRELTKAAGVPVGAVVYDGDTPGDARRAARERAGIVLTNPDMLHTGILPHHTSWARTMQHLRYVVVDELHTYKGVFGSHVANVLRRLVRVARFHGSNPQIIGATATIGNPRAHAARMFGVRPDEVELLDESGAPRGERRFFLFNPPVVNAELGIRASYVKQAVMLAADLVRARVPTIVFGQSRNTVEVMLRYLRDAVATGGERTDKGAGIDPTKIMAYRGGYLPEQRRDIERRLRDGDILCVVATNALELGIDIGELDAVVCAGYPGSIAGTWQRLGRAGRRGGQSIGVLVASSAPLDQYLAREPEYFLGSPVEEARVDPDNVEILVQHLKCAAFEMPFKRGESFGSLGAEETAEALGFLERHRVVHESAGTFHWAADAYPANDVSLRTVGWDNVVIIDVEHDRSIGELDWRAAQTMLHEQAIYQHDGECWQVERFDHENHKAFVRKVAPDYWTSAMTYVEVRVLEQSASGAVVNGAWSGGWGEVAVVEKVVGYKKIKFYTHENAGYGDVRLPEMQMHTTAFWVTVPEAVCEALPEGRAAAIDGLRGVGVALETVATLALMCDPRDLGTTLGDADEDAEDGVPRRVRGGLQAGFAPTLFLYEHVPGGTGLAERVWEERDVLLARALRLIEGCACPAGCPACVGPGEAARKAVAVALLRSAVPTA